jgi:hypothetical protein
MAVWLVTCSCGWTRKCSSQWAAESVAKLHPKLGEPGTAHTVRIEEPPDRAESLNCRSPSSRTQATPSAAGPPPHPPAPPTA